MTIKHVAPRHRKLYGICASNGYRAEFIPGTDDVVVAVDLWRLGVFKWEAWLTHATKIDNPVSLMLFRDDGWHSYVLDQVINVPATEEAVLKVLERFGKVVSFERKRLLEKSELPDFRKSAELAGVKE